MPIDLHAHWMPEEVYNTLQARGKKPNGYVPVEMRLGEMDEHGYSHGVLSLPIPDAEDDETALEVSRVFNDATAAAIKAHPDRFSGFAALPTYDIEVMIEEFERAMEAPGMVGCVLPGDGFLSLERALRFRPFLRAANDKGAVILVHYGRVANDPEGRVKDLTDNQILRRGTLDMQSRISENMLTFCFTDYLSDFPKVTMLTHNLGGNIPFEVERMDHRMFTQKAADGLPSEILRKAPIMVDCNSFGPRSIEMAVGVYGAEKIVCGSDGTSFGMGWTNKALRDAKISEEEKDLIRDGNAIGALGKLNPLVAER